MEKSGARLWWYKTFIMDGFLFYIWIISFIFDQQELICLFLLSLFTSIPPFLSFFFQLKKNNKLGKQVSMIYLGTRVVC